jgi:hypothetical protein
MTETDGMPAMAGKAGAMKTFSRVRGCRSGWAIAGSAICSPPSHALLFWGNNIFSI